MRTALHSLAVLTGFLLVASGTALALAPVTAPLPGSAPSRETAAHADPGQDRGPIAPDTQEQPTDPEIDALRMTLLRQLERAAEAGFVEMRKDGPPPRDPIDLPQIHPVVAPSEIAPAQGAPIYGPSRPDLMATEVAEATFPLAAVTETAPEATAPAIVAHCLDADVFPDPSSTPPNPFAQDVAQARAALAGEFDRADPEAVRKLAWVYLSHGFTEEAQLIADELRTQTAWPKLIIDVVEGEPVAAGSFEAPDCGAEHRLFQVANSITEGKVTRAVVEVDGLKETLRRQPRFLRSLLAQRFGGAALMHGDLKLAAWMLNLAEMDVLGIDMPGIPLLRARLAKAQGRPGAALRSLALLRPRLDTYGAEASLLAAEIALAGTPEVLAGTQALQVELGAISHLWRNTELGARAVTAEAELLAASEGQASAFSFLDEAGRMGLVSHERRLAITSDVSDDVGGSESPTSLAVLYNARPERFAGALADRGFRIALAKSYAALDAPQLVRAVVEQTDLTDSGLSAALSEAALRTRDADLARWLLGYAPSPVAAQEQLSRLAGRLPADAATGTATTEHGGAGEGTAAQPPNSLEAAIFEALELLENGEEIPAEMRDLIAEASPSMAADLVALEALSGQFSGSPADEVERLITASELELNTLRRLIDDG